MSGVGDYGGGGPVDSGPGNTTGHEPDGCAIIFWSVVILFMIIYCCATTFNNLPR